MEILAGLFFLILPLLALRIVAVLVTVTRRARQNLAGVRL